MGVAPVGQAELQTDRKYMQEMRRIRRCNKRGEETILFLTIWFRSVCHGQ